MFDCIKSLKTENVNRLIIPELQCTVQCDHHLHNMQPHIHEQEI